jgi:hypothetical protein
MGCLICGILFFVCAFIDSQAAQYMRWKNAKRDAVPDRFIKSNKNRHLSLRETSVTSRSEEALSVGNRRWKPASAAISRRSREISYCESTQTLARYEISRLRFETTAQRAREGIPRVRVTCVTP